MSAPAPLFSVCTLVTDPAQHAAMRASFAARGFGPDEAEFLAIDNSAGNSLCAYRGVARLLDQARGRWVILCHQDVRLLQDGATELMASLAKVEAQDPDWAIAGNAGATEDGALVLRISDPHGEDQRRGSLPARVGSLDENFLVLRAEAGLRPSAGLGGFHLYGTDLCLQARRAGRTAWAIDFHLRHLSAGRVDHGFLALQDAFERHWGALMRRRMTIRTTCTTLTLRAGLVGHCLGAWRLARRRRRL